jgi:hypothetical protein
MHSHQQHVLLYGTNHTVGWDKSGPHVPIDCKSRIGQEDKRRKDDLERRPGNVGRCSRGNLLYNDLYDDTESTQ